ncbi:hypothetical protein DPEC_G00351720 [Dallia pectoralis]|uniref:Uncharacterized protein n=1 Tax=Dallia pectoralis TaxID=75939 RepID=A0ACC2F242_DALPE|nr:hypothetical protein DPEC_G00351720 [Dallia pectoralis]
MKSKKYSLLHHFRTVDPWSLKPPDFSPKLYMSQSLPRRQNIKNKQKSALTLDFKSKLMFVKTGKHPLGPYRNPEHHNFRPLADNMPDVITATERDPGDLTFKLQHLSTVSDSSSVTDIYPRDALGKIDTCKPKEPRWDARLTLPMLPWPPKSASYTRHRRRRGVYSALMDRVEEKVKSSRSGKSG